MLGQGSRLQRSAALAVEQINPAIAMHRLPELVVLEHAPVVQHLDDDARVALIDASLVLLFGRLPDCTRLMVMIGQAELVVIANDNRHRPGDQIGSEFILALLAHRLRLGVHLVEPDRALGRMQIGDPYLIQLAAAVRL